MAPPRDRVARVPALIVHGGAGADPAEEPDELRAGVTAAALAGWRVLEADGRALEAVEAAARALEDGNRTSETGAHGLLGEVARCRDPINLDAMERHVSNALVLAEMLEMRPVAARCHLRLAWLYEKIGRPESDRHAALATSLLEQMGRPRSLDAAGVH